MQKEQYRGHDISPAEDGAGYDVYHGATYICTRPSLNMARAAVGVHVARLFGRDHAKQPPAYRSPRAPKTVIEWEVQGLWAGQWETETAADSWEEARRLVTEYRANQPEVPHRIKRIRVPI